MKITKYLHSCLLIQEQEISVLIDPGQYTYDEHVLNMDILPKLDYILITHEHSDHMSIPLIKELILRNPNLQVISNQSVATQLQGQNIQVATQSQRFLEMTAVPHEDVVVSVPPENTQFTLFGKITHPGDSHHIRNSAPILCLPIQAPWGSFADALKLAEEISPKFIIPIHDWHWKDTVRKSMYARSAEYLKLSEIEFKQIDTGVTIEINA